MSELAPEELNFFSAARFVSPSSSKATHQFALCTIVADRSLHATLVMLDCTLLIWAMLESPHPRLGSELVSLSPWLFITTMHYKFRWIRHRVTPKQDR